MFTKASNLLNRFEKVVVFDLNKQSMDALVAKGAKAAASVKDLASQCQVIVTMLPATAHVQQTLQGADGVFQNAKMPNTLVIDCSTIDPNASKDLHAQAKAHGHRMLDALVWQHHCIHLTTLS